MKQDQITNQSRIRTAKKVEGADNIINIPPTTNNGIAEGGEERKKPDLRLIKKKYRPALYAKKAEMELGVINKFGNVLSQETVTLTGLANAVVVQENAVTSSAIAGNIVLKKKGKGLDLRYLKKDFRNKYKQVDEAAQAEIDRKINEKIATLQIISNEDLIEILAMANINPLGDKIVANDEEDRKKKDEEFITFLKGSSFEVKAE